MKKRIIHILYIVFSAVAAILNGLPVAVKLRFAGPDRSYYQYCSGYDLLPVGYAVWGPMIAGILAIVLTALGLYVLFKPSKTVKKWMLGLCSIGWFMSTTPVFLGTVTIVGSIVSTLLVAQIVLMAFFDEDYVKKS